MCRLSVWLPSLCIRFLRFINVVVCISILFLFIADSNPLLGYTMFCLSIHQYWTYGYFLDFHYYESIAFLFFLPNLLDPLPHGFLGELQFLFLYGGKNWGFLSPSLKLTHLASEFRGTKGPHRIQSSAHLTRQVDSKQPAFLCCHPQGMAACLPRLDYEFLVGRPCWPSFCDVRCP